MKGLFITGTDTGVGKTVVSAALCRNLRAAGISAVVLKPFATGIDERTDWRDNDPLFLSAAMDYMLAPELISMVRLGPALSPYDAARINGTLFDLDAVASAINHTASSYDFVIVEGVGGVAVPLTANTMVADFIQMLDLPTLVVGRSQIGTVNHTVLTVNALRSKRVHIEGLIFNRKKSGPLELDEMVGPETACRLVRAADFGLVDFSDALSTANTLDEAVAGLPVNDPTVLSLTEHVSSLASRAS